MTSEKLKRRSWAKPIDSFIGPPNENGCRLWQGAMKTWGASPGYGVYKLNGVQTNAHRAVWITTYGPIPRTVFVCHKCDVRACCELTHLFLGSAKDNTADMKAKGRAHKARGEQVGPTKLTRLAVEAIRTFNWTGILTNKEIGAVIGTSQANVASIRRGESWKS